MKIAIVMFAIALTSCTTMSPALDSNIICASRDIEPITTLPVRWKLGRETETGIRVVGLDGENYSNLAKNMSRIIEYTSTSKQYIVYLENCITRYNAEAEQ
jgi:hypothetical protein